MPQAGMERAFGAKAATTSSRLEMFSDALPRVAPSSQPWALGQNLFEVPRQIGQTAKWCEILPKLHLMVGDSASFKTLDSKLEPLLLLLEAWLFSGAWCLD